MRRALTVVELLLAVAILGVLAALSLPAISHAAPSDEVELRASLARLRTAIALYRDEQGCYPGGGGPIESDELIRALTSPPRVYLEGGWPKSPFADADAAPVRLSGSGPSRAHWVYDPQTGYITADSDGVDARGVRYDQY